jgi:hypothetical protein
MDLGNREPGAVMASGTAGPPVRRTGPRLPDFIVIGTMKSGSSSLYMWLNQQPEVFMPEKKEPDFFSREESWSRGIRWYASLFAPVVEGQLAGEASVSYTNPRLARVAAERMRGVLPAARLIYLLRHPLERMASHYRHQLQRGREARPFGEALRDPGNEYVAQSCYYACLEPYLERFPREQICVVRLEDMTGEPAPGWSAVLRHLGLDDRQAPGTAYNVTSGRFAFTPTMVWIKRLGLHRSLRRLPPPVRRVGRRVVARRDAEYRRRLEESHGPPPPEAAALVREDVERLERWLGVDPPLWDRKGLE